MTYHPLTALLPSRSSLLPRDQWRIAIAPLRSALAFYGLLAVITAVTLVLVLKLWRADLRVPFSYGTDGVAFLTFSKFLQDGAWFYQSDLVGAPNGLQMYDYPITDNCTYLIIKLLVLITSNYVVANNVFFLLTFILAAITSAIVLRRLKVSGPVAIVFSVLYAFIPYHFLRGEAQLLLSAYYVVPLVVLLALSMWSDAPESLFYDGRGGAASRFEWRRYAAILAICVIAGSSSLYYAFFGCLLVAVACLAQLLETPRLRVLARGALVLGALGGTVLINMVPTLLYYARHGPNLQVARRSAPEAEVHGLKIVHLLLPIGEHRLELFRRLAGQYAAGQPPLQGENAAATLGVVGSLGFLGLLVALIVRRAHEGLGVYYRLAVLNLACVLFATIGGFSSLFALLVSPQFRAPNRISIVIAFLALAAAAVFVEQLRARWATSNVRALAFNGALALLLVVGILDQTSPAFVPAYAGVREQFASDAAFVGAIERSVPPQSMIFQLPWMPFPESVGVRQVWPYDLFRGYLHSHQLRWSFGAMQGRGPEWQRKVADAPTDEMVARLAAVGFAGIYVDRNGYDDAAGRLAGELEQVLGTKPIASPDGRLLFFSMEPFNQALQRNHLPPAIARYGYSTLYPLEIHWGTGFYGTETVAGAQSRWGSNDAELTISNPGATARTVRLNMRLATGVDAASIVAVSGDLLNERVAVVQTPTSLSRDVVIPPGVHRVRFQADAPPLTPAPGDPRRLVFRLIGFELVDADDVLVAAASPAAS